MEQKVCAMRQGDRNTDKCASSHRLALPVAAASYQLSWSIYVSDYSRYLPRDVGVRASFWWTYLGAFIGGAWMMLVGSIAAAVFPRLDVPVAAGVYLLACRSMDLEADRRRAAEADCGLEPAIQLNVASRR
jgi:hypothetical protein